MITTAVGRARPARQPVRFLGGLTAAAAVVVGIVGGLGIVQAVEDLVGAPTAYSAPTVGLNASALHLVGARGDTLTFYLADNSVKGLWAAPSGLRLDLATERTGFKNSARVVQPKQKGWTDPVFYFSTAANRGAGNEFEIRGSFTIPDVPGPEVQILTGRLVGEFLYPGRTTDEEHFFTESRSLDIPTTVRVVSAKESGRIHSGFRRMRFGRIALGLLYFVFAMGYALSYGIWRDREQARRWEPYLTLLLGTAVWACFGALWLKPFGA